MALALPAPPSRAYVPLRPLVSKHRTCWIKNRMEASLGTVKVALQEGGFGTTTFQRGVCRWLRPTAAMIREPWTSGITEWNVFKTYPYMVQLQMIEFNLILKAARKPDIASAPGDSSSAPWLCSHSIMQVGR